MKTLYVRRPLKNRDDVAAWAKAQGLELQDGAHVTIAFSKNPIKWPKEASNPFFIPESAEQKDGTRSVDVLGEGAIVLRFKSTLLQDRFSQLRALGASWDFDEYQPHITICYDPEGEIDVGKINPYLGPLVFGPEVFAEVKLKPPALEIAMDEAFAALMAEIQAQTEPALAFDRAPEALLDRHGVMATLAFDRDLNEGRTTDGFERMHVKRAPITKAGVNPYYGREIPKGRELGLLPDKVYKLLRHPDEIKKGAATSHNVPLLNQHVPHSADDHDGDITVGTVGSNAEYVHPVLYNSLAIWSRDGIDNVESKKQKELSSAYGYDADMTPGDYEGEPYDGVIRNMKWNHVCLVKKGRAGSDIALDEALQPQQETTTMKLKSMKATVAYGALTTHLRPLLAMDAAMPNLAGALATFEPGKFKESIPPFIAALKKSLGKVKLAQDADLAGVVNGVQKLMSAIGDDKVVEDEKMERDPNEQDTDGADMDGDDTAMDGGGMEAVKAYLAEKGVPEDIIAGIPGGEPKDPAAIADDGELEDDAAIPPGGKKKKDEDKPFDKGAMDAAIKKAQNDTVARMQGIEKAKEAVRPIVGGLPGMAFDSAEGVYRHAFKMRGQDVAKIKELPALEQMWSMLPVPGAKPARDSIAQDGETVSDYKSRFPHAAAVKRA